MKTDELHVYIRFQSTTSTKFKTVQS